MKADIERLHEIDRLCFPPRVAFSRRQLLWFILQPCAITRIAVLASRVVGFAIGHVETPVIGHIITLDVAPEARRRKVGTILMDMLHEEFRRKGLVEATLEVAAMNSTAQKFYSRLRYRCVEILHGYYGDGSDAYRMIRAL